VSTEFDSLHWGCSFYRLRWGLDVSFLVMAFIPMVSFQYIQRQQNKDVHLPLLF
jgi:hypothetical protein